MPLKGVHCALGYVDMDEHMKCMVEEPGPPCGLEPSILQMMTRPNTERTGEGVIFSPSTISSCHRRDVLASNHDWYMDVEQGWKMIRGTIIHEGMGHEPPYPGVLGVVRELRMGAPINTKYGEQRFHGKPDLVVLLNVETKQTYQTVEIGDGQSVEVYQHGDSHNILHVKIVDYKTKSEVGHDLVAADRRYVYQVNEYAWIVQQFLPGWLNDTSGNAMSQAGHLQLDASVEELPHIDEVVVDELSITYMDMKKTRTFSSKAMLYADGKMLSDFRNGRWIRRNPPEHEELELEPIHQFKPEYMESHIRRGIEEQIKAQKLLALPLVGDDAKLMCRSCPVRQVCYETGIQEGYDMDDQRPFVAVGL
jgi:PD-(D/E)XK nuclease superfamily